MPGPDPVCLVISGMAHCRFVGNLCRMWLAALLMASAIGPLVETAAAQTRFPEQDTLTGDWDGVRIQLRHGGVKFAMTDTAETLSDPIGGIRQQTIYQGLLKPSLKLDLDRLVSWPNGSFYIDAYQISGRGLSRNAIGNLLAVSNIEALASTRLHDLWLQQDFPEGVGSLRVGQIGLDDEFYISQYSSMFVNSTFGCPDLLSTDLPSGGPCYPFATPGARFQATPIASVSFSAAAFNGNPAPPGPGDPQVRNSSGTNFLIGQGGFLTIAELAYAFDKEPSSSDRLSDVKLGAWYHTADFADLRRDTFGRSLADPARNGIAAAHSGNFGAYLIADKMLWRRPDVASPGLAAFLRIGGAPGDRNLITFELDTGLSFQGPFPQREGDVAGIAASYALISGSARHFDRDAVVFIGMPRPVRNHEGVIEITYQARISSWWLLQPDLQLVFNPGGHIAAPPPARAGAPIPNTLVLGLRSVVTF